MLRRGMWRGEREKRDRTKLGLTEQSIFPLGSLGKG